MVVWIQASKWNFYRFNRLCPTRTQTDRHTNTHTDHATCNICSNAPHLCSAWVLSGFVIDVHIRLDCHSGTVLEYSGIISMCRWSFYHASCLAAASRHSGDWTLARQHFLWLKAWRTGRQAGRGLDLRRLINTSYWRRQLLLARLMAVVCRSRLSWFVTLPVDGPAGRRAWRVAGPAADTARRASKVTSR